VAAKKHRRGRPAPASFAEPAVRASVLHAEATALMSEVHVRRDLLDSLAVEFSHPEIDETIRRLDATIASYELSGREYDRRERLMELKCETNGWRWPPPGYIP
jgi:hypothetical protein